MHIQHAQECGNQATLILEGISKRFGTAQALDGINLTIRAGRVHALIGENGAGKSTLSKIVSGIYRPDIGIIRLAGETVEFDGPFAASAAGVHIVHQELALLPYNTVTENLFLGREIKGRFGLNWREMDRKARECFTRLGLDLDVNQPVSDLSTAEQQMVEIARIMLRKLSVVIMDEPTAALSPAYKERLFDVLRQIKQQGTAIIYISHRLDEIAELADEITVLKDGKHIITGQASDFTIEDMIRLMVGRPIDQLFPDKATKASAEVVLEIDGLADAPRLRDASFKVAKGEIVGIYGLDGHGQDEILACIGGARRPMNGHMKLRGNSLPWSSVPKMIAHGVGFVPEDRKSEGLILDMSGNANVALPILKRLSRVTIVNRQRECEIASRAANEVGVRGSLDAPVRSLSGGNQQKVLLARLCAAGTSIFLLNQPTRGVDVGAKSEIYTLVRRLCEEHGASALVVAREISELKGFCDRILVMSHGRMIAECSPDDSEEKILAAAVGHEVAKTS